MSPECPNVLSLNCYKSLRDLTHLVCMKNLQPQQKTENLIMTAAINPGTKVNVRMSNTEERLFQYLCSLISWIQYSNISSIIFCDNTNYNYNYQPIINMAKDFSKNLEILKFKGNEKSYKYRQRMGRRKNFRLCLSEQ